MQTDQSSSRFLNGVREFFLSAAGKLAGSKKAADAKVSNATVVRSSDREGVLSLFDIKPASSGFLVNDKTAMQISTVYSCLTVKSGAVVQLPIHHYKKTTDGQRERVIDSDLWWLLNESPCPAWTSPQWMEWIIRCIALRGDQHTRILRSSNTSGGKIIGFEPLHPDYVTARRIGARLVYDCFDRYSNKMETIDQDDMLHFTGFGFDGEKSPSAIQTAARQSIGNSLAAADYMGRTVGEGAMPKIVLSYPNLVGIETAAQLRKQFIETYMQPGQQRPPLVLTEGGTAAPLSITPVDMEIMSMRQFEREDICQALGVPPVLIGDSSKASSWGTGIEQITLGFVKFNIKPLLVKIEKELNRKIFRRAGQFVEFELDGLLRGDSKAQAEAFKAALGGPGVGDGYMTVNEVRKLRNLPPDDDPLSNIPYKAQRGVAPKESNA